MPFRQASLWETHGMDPVPDLRQRGRVPHPYPALREVSPGLERLYDSDVHRKTPFFATVDLGYPMSEEPGAIAQWTLEEVAMSGVT